MNTHILKKVISFVIGLTIILFLLRYLWSYMGILKDSNFSIKWNMLFLSYFSGFLSFFLYSVAWHYLLRYEGAPLTFMESNYMLSKGNLGKYIPGRVWQFVGRLYLFNHLGFSRTKIIMVAMLEQYFLLLSAFIIFGISYLSFQNIFANSFLLDIKPLIIVGLIIAFLSLHPRSITLWNRIILKITKKEELQFFINTKDILLLMMIYLTYWVFIGLSVLFLIKGGIEIPIKYIFLVISSNAIAYLIGYISIITPNGLGVREGVLTYLLEIFLMKGLGAIISILSRIMLITQEIGYFFLAFFLYKYSKRGIATNSK